MTKHSESLRAADFMNRRVHTVPPALPLEALIQVLLRHELSNVPVVEGGEGVGHRLLGFVSERDCLAALADECFFGSPRPPWTAGTIMRRHPVCVAPDTELFALTSLFTNHGYRHLPVTEEGRLLGLVSRRDVLRAMNEVDRKTTRESAEERFPDLSLVVTHRFPAAD